MQSIYENIADERIRCILETISNNYPEKFNSELIDTEFEYIKNKLNWKYYDKQNTVTKLKTTINKTSENNSENKCSGRVWSNYIFSRKTNKSVDDVNDKFKVKDFNDLNIKEFNDKYIIGKNCKNFKIKNSEYCKLHSKHLIHGNYLETPSKELCYHFMKDGKYL